MKTNLDCCDDRADPAIGRWAKSSNRIPLGMTTASRPRCWTTTLRADSDTAMPTSIFSIAARSTPLPIAWIAIAELRYGMWPPLAVRCPQRQQGDARRNGLVDVNEVEPAVS